MEIAKLFLWLVALQAAPIAAFRTVVTLDDEVIDTASEVTKAAPKCGHLMNTAMACYPVHSDSRMIGARKPCDGKCTYVAAEDVQPGGLRGCQCDDPSKKCKSVSSKNPGLAHWSAKGSSGAAAVKVDPDTKQWSYLKMDNSDGVATWEFLGTASSLDSDQIMQADPMHSAEFKLHLKEHNLASMFGMYSQDPCNPLVMATYAKFLVNASVQEMRDYANSRLN